MYANAVPWYSGATAAHTSFPVLLSRRRRYDIDHTSPRCEGQVLWRGVLLGGVVQGRAGGVVGERVGQAAHGGDGCRGYRGYQGSRRLSHRLRPLPRRRLSHSGPAGPPRPRWAGRTRAYRHPARLAPAAPRRRPARCPAGPPGRSAHGRAREARAYSMRKSGPMALSLSSRPRASGRRSRDTG